MERPTISRAGRDGGDRMRLVLWALKASKSLQLETEATTKKGRGVIIPAKNVYDLMSGKAQFPYEIKTSTSSMEQKTINICHLEEKDLDSVVQMCSNEYGSYSLSS
mmetsp:Transcript_10478/g.15557  ORF Transcript_10478/g.15557 Transcript_10478/m.15557 type:complete len:106 (-) Transcript_10478:269-586(-)